MKELDFTIEFNAKGLDERLEAKMFGEADRQLRQLAGDGDHKDLTGAAINVRQPTKAETAFLYEVTVVVYARPENLVASKEEDDPVSALKSSLSAIERQVRKKRELLQKRWQQPGNDAVSKEVIDVLAAEDLDL